MRLANSVPHTLVVYEDLEDRNRHLEDLLFGNGARWTHLIVFTNRPGTERALFTKFAKKAHLRRNPDVIDLGPILEEADPTSRVFAVSAECKHRLPKGSAPVVVGDWHRRSYSNFNHRMAVEEEETRRKQDGVICSYPWEGFWSLEPKAIARLFEIHPVVRVGSKVLQMAA